MKFDEMRMYLEPISLVKSRLGDAGARHADNEEGHGGDLQHRRGVHRVCTSDYWRFPEQVLWSG